MMFYKNTKPMVLPPESLTDFFNVDVGVLQGDTLAPYQFKICQNYLLRMSIDLM